MSLSIWGFTSTISDSFSIKSYALSQAGSNLSYQVSSVSNVKYDLTLLSSCPFPCKTCENANISSCRSCYSSALTPSYFLDTTTRSCVTPTSCPSGSYPNTTSSTCIACPSACSLCSSPSVCSSCRSNYYLLNNTCLTDCPAGFYPITPLQACGSCTGVNNTANCATCLTINSCITCQYPYYLSPSAKGCVASCASN